MPRPMLGGSQLRSGAEQKQDQFLSTRGVQKTEQKQMSRMEMDRLLRKPRSKEYMEAMHALDTGGHVHNEHRTEEIISAIRKEFPEVELQGVLLGIVSKCYLGAPYEVHSLQIDGSIIEHYKRGNAMPDGLEKARGIALCGSYDFVEVYLDCCRAVSSTGAVSVIR